VMGRDEAFKLMGKAVVAAAMRNKEAGVTTASHVNGQTVVSGPAPKILAQPRNKARSKLKGAGRRAGR